MKSYGGYLRHLRDRQRLSQLDIANFLEISQSTISLWESDKSTPQVNHLPKLAKILKVEVIKLLPNEELEKNEDIETNIALTSMFEQKKGTSELLTELLESKEEIIFLLKEEINRLKCNK